MYIDAKLPPPNSKIWSIVLTPRRRQGTRLPGTNVHYFIPRHLSQEMILHVRWCLHE